jgi:hypothetical protein
MGNDRLLTNNKVHDTFVAAHEVLGDAAGETVRRQTALKAARRALNLLQIDLAAMEKGSDHVEGVIDQSNVSKRV